MNSKLVIALTLVIVTLGTTIALAAGHKRVNNKDVITLTSKNTLIMRSVFTANSVKDLQIKAAQLSENLSDNEPIYLYLNTPGGSVEAGLALIETLKNLPQKVNTITDFSVSMGYITSQSLGDRYVLNHGTFMSHRATGGAEGNLPGTLNSRVNFFTNQMLSIENDMAKRMNIPLVAYEAKIENEFWIEGKDAVAENVADKIVGIWCDRSLSGTYTESVETAFGSVAVEWAACPNVTAPVSVNTNKLSFVGVSKERQEEIKNAIYQIIVDKRAFLGDTSSREIYTNLVR